MLRTAFLRPALAALGLVAISDQPLSAKTFRECGCDSFLSAAVQTVRKEEALSVHRDASRYYFCRTDEGEALKTMDIRTSAGIVLPNGLPVSGQGNAKRENFRKWRSESCEVTLKDEFALDILRRSETELPPGAFGAANACFKTCNTSEAVNTKVVCQLSDLSSTSALLRVRWGTQVDPPAPVIRRPIVVTNGRFESKTEALQFGTGKPLGNVDRTAVLIRSPHLRPLTVNVETSAGSCSKTLLPQETHIRVTGTVSVSGTSIVTQTKRTGPHNHENGGSCTETPSPIHHHDVCFDQGFTVTSGNALIVRSDRGHSQVQLKVPAENCGRVLLWYYDRGRSRRSGRCKGHGYIVGGAEFAAQKINNWGPNKINVRQEGPASDKWPQTVIIDFPIEAGAVPGNTKVVYDLIVETFSAGFGNKVATFRVSDQQPASQRIISSVRDGRIVVTLDDDE